MTKLASIQPILAVETHPNADSLDIVQVLGYRAIVKRGAWKVGDLCVFIEPDSVLPDQPWAAFYKAKSNRVKAIRLRGSWSFGVVEKPETLNLQVEPEAIGMDVTNLIGVIKYEPPMPQDLNASGPYGYGIPKTDETRLQSLDPADLPPWGTLVDVTLKVDGQSWTAFVKLNEDGSVERGVGGRSFLYKPDGENAYIRAERKHGVLDKLEAFCRQTGQSLALRGESYGQGIQKGGHNPHSKLPNDLALFSVWVIDERRYAHRNDPLYIHTIAPVLGLPTVPVLEKAVPLTPELIQRYDEGLEQIGGQPFEGVVINHTNGSFKVINKAYDSRK